MPSMMVLHMAPVLEDKILEELPDLEEEFEESFELPSPEEDEDEQLIIFMVCSGLNGKGTGLLPTVLLLQLLETFCCCRLFC